MGTHNGRQKRGRPLSTRRTEANMSQETASPRVCQTVMETVEHYFSMAEGEGAVATAVQRAVAGEGQGSNGRNFSVSVACAACVALHAELPRELAEVMPEPDQEFIETAIAKLFPTARREGIKDEGELGDAVQAVYLQLAATVDMLSGMGEWDSLSKS